MNNKLSLAVLAALILTACNSEKPYTISGEFDYPMTFEYGDTVIERPSLEGMMVYLFDVDQNVVDSAEVDADEHFRFEGTVDAKDPQFYFLATGIQSGLMVIEPGDITVVAGDELTVTGTPLNDGITDLDAAVSNLQQDTYMQYTQLLDSLGDKINDSHLMPLYESMMVQTQQLLDSFYLANKSNLVGVYAIHYMTSQASTVDQLDSALAEYDDYIRQQPLFQMRRTYYQQMEEQELSARDFDSSIFNLDADSVK